MSRKREIREMANLVGNSAAHIALLPDSDFAMREATAYTDDAAETAAGRTWNEADIERFGELALRRAASEIKERIVRYGIEGADYGALIGKAEKYISAFIENNMEKEG